MENRGVNKKYNIYLLILFGVVLFFIFNSLDKMQIVALAFMPIVYAFIIAYILDPLVTKLSKRLKIPRWASVTIIFLLIMIFIFLAIQYIIPNIVASAKSLLATIPDVNEINKTLTDIFSKIVGNTNSEIINQLNSLMEKTITQIGVLSAKLLEGFVDKIFGLTSGIFTGVISIVVSIYILIDKRLLVARIKRGLYAFVKNDTANKILDISRIANTTFKSFFIGKLLDSTIIGIIAFVVLRIFSIPFASIISLLIGITNMIPYFGPFIGGIPSVILVLFISPVKAIELAIIILLIQQFDGLILGPKILGSQVGVKAFWIITSVTIGGNLFGVWGMLLGVPIVVLIKRIFEDTVSKKLNEKGMGDFLKEDL